MKQTPIEETYHFQCTCCGDCCTGDMEININLYDLCKISKYLKLKDSRDLFNKGFVKLIQNQNECRTPQIIFKTKPFKFCPWLINDMGEDEVLRGFCSLHPFFKPLICKMAPAGRVVDFDNDSISYMLTSPTDSCPGMLSSTVNKLSGMKRELKEELEYEYRFYRILDNLENRKLSEKVMMDDYYCFSPDRDWNYILSELEKKSEIFVN